MRIPPMPLGSALTMHYVSKFACFFFHVLRSRSGSICLVVLLPPNPRWIRLRALLGRWRLAIFKWSKPTRLFTTLQLGNRFTFQSSTQLYPVAQRLLSLVCTGHLNV